MRITFLGANETVTGSKYLLNIDSKTILVDCGLFQGQKELRLRNWNPFPVDPKTIDYVIITHAHIDHTGYLPLLVKNGYKNKILATPATKDLCSILLPDSGHLQEEEAMFANKMGYSKHKPALPLYTAIDAQESLKYFKTVDFGTSYNLSDNCSFRFHRAGHILGASFVEIKFGSKTLFFTGDMGRTNDPLMFDPDFITGANYLVTESTYGDRLHEPLDVQEQIGQVIRTTVERGGSIIIPAFAVGRAQSLLYYIYQLKKEKKIPNIKVFLDSPMAISATNMMLNNINDHRLSAKQCIEIFKSAHYVNTPDESKAIDHYKMPIIIISASGMATGGRILFHLEAYAGDPRNTLLFTGYQESGTRGARIIRGEPEVKIHGRMIPIKAHVEQLRNASAHADYQGILDWLSHFKRAPEKTFIVHGEPQASLSLKTKIEETYGWRCAIPEYMHSEKLS